MSKYMRKKKPNRILVGILCFLMTLVLMAAVVVGFVWSKLDKITYASEISDDTEPPMDVSAPMESEPEVEDYVVDIGSLQKAETAPPIPEATVNEDDDVLNILLIGTDERTTKYNTNARADSMILVSINKDKNTVKLVSLERGIGVPILEGDKAGEYDLLTHIFRWGGADLLVKTVEHCFKVDVKHYVRLNFASVEKIIDCIGGIDMELSSAEAEGLNVVLGESKTPMHSGVNRMDGETALQFARLRYIDSDWQRVGRQRKVILAVVEELKGSSLLELNELADEVLPLIQTNLTKLEIAELILYAPNFLTSEFDQMTIPKQGTYGGMNIRKGAGAFAVDYDINNDILYRFLYEGVSSEELLAE